MKAYPYEIFRVVDSRPWESIRLDLIDCVAADELGISSLTLHQSVLLDLSKLENPREKEMTLKTILPGFVVWGHYDEIANVLYAKSIHFIAPIQPVYGTFEHFSGRLSAAKLIGIDQHKRYYGTSLEGDGILVHCAEENFVELRRSALEVLLEGWELDGVKLSRVGEELRKNLAGTKDPIEAARQRFQRLFDAA